MSVSPRSQTAGAEFRDDAVVRAYVHRTPYPAALIARLAELASGHDAALDLGCGPGKLAAELAGVFAHVVAVDPSPAMIAAGKALKDRPNVTWIEATAEAVELRGLFNLAVAGASIHWMDHAAVFPKLRRSLVKGGPVAVVAGDGPAEAPWFERYHAVRRSWIERLGGEYNDPQFVARMTAHEAWIDVVGRESFEADCQMPLEHLIESEHSRATFTHAKMGRDWARVFDADLRAVLTPHADQGAVRFRTRTTLLWGQPRSSPRT